VSHRPLVLVSGLTLGDYLLWNWSLSANHDMLALVSGLTLPALSMAFIWLLALNLARLVAHSSHRSRARAGGRLRHAERGDPHAERGGPAYRTYAPAATAAERDRQDATSATDSSATSPGKLAA
jgi:hypothetical protein